MAEWQAMEKAPKDGHPILGFGGDCDDETGVIEVMRWEPLSYNWEPSWTAGPRCGEHSFRHGFYPTHWMPIPEPPE